MQITCLYCNNNLTRQTKYCSNKCQNLYQWQLSKENIIKNGKFPATENGKLAKRFLKERDGIRCSICNLTTWLDKPIPLILDHIDGNALNWDIANLRMICGNCDMFLPTYKNRNKGNGRQARRLRYKPQ